MNDVLEIDNFLNTLQQQELKKILIGNKLDWYYISRSTTDSDSGPGRYFVGHETIQDSPAFMHMFFQQNYLNAGTHSTFRSEAATSIENYFFITKIFSENIEKHLHQSINLYSLKITLFTPNPNYNHLHMPPHTDWKFPHKTLIYYVNSCDGDTFIFNEYRNQCKNYEPLTVKKQITPKQGSAIIFDGLNYHAASPSKKELQIIINCTFTVNQQ